MIVRRAISRDDIAVSHIQPGDFSQLRRFLEPVEVGGGDPLLGERRKVAHQGVASAGVEFAEDVVHQVDREFSAALLQQFSLGEFQGEGERALLAFAGEIRGGHAVEAEIEVVAVRADD